MCRSAHTGHEDNARVAGASKMGDSIASPVWARTNVRPERRAILAAMASADPYAALDAVLMEHRLCRPGLDDPDVSPMLVALWCSCGARIAVRFPPLPGGA
jgi:hypothetical protein